MIISKIIGGLGNQMFQYAAGRTLAHLNKTFVKLDVTSFEKDRLRNFDLLCFNANIGFASKHEINDLLPAHNFEKAFQYFSPLNRRSYYREKGFQFNKQVLSLGKNVYLKGYFQSEKYFLSAKDIIRSEFAFKSNVIESVKQLSSILNGQNSIAVHIRRGDFSKNSDATDYHGTLEINYYQEAISIINSKFSDPIFYFFSDDIKWVKENYSLPNSTFVSGEITKNHFEDLYLMSQCRHNIIANSSFSWWGAWLNDNPNKIVIAPKKWFNKGPKDTQDLIPEGWLKV